MPKLVVMCVDSLFTSDLADVYRYPGFGAVLHNARIYKDIQCIYPTLTYPCHASIMSGTWPERHGIPHNEVLDPARNNANWYWFYRDLRVKTVFDYAKEAGLRTAAVQWPVTAGGPIDYLIPEIWTLDSKADPDQAFLPTISTGAREVYLANKHLLDWKENPAFDNFGITCGADFIRRYQPDVLFLHQATLDHVRHVYGVHAVQVQEALRLHDGWIQRIIAALRETNMWEDTVFAVLGDHGQLQVDYNVHPNVLLAQAGLLHTDAAGAVLPDWRAYCQSCGLSAQVFVKQEADVPAVAAVLGELQDMGYVQQVLTADQAQAQWHLRGAFRFVMEGAPNHAFANTATGELVTSADRGDYKSSVSTHGHLPIRGDKPCLIVHGKRVEPGVSDGARLIDEAPTLLTLAGIPYDASAMDGHSLV